MIWRDEADCQRMAEQWAAMLGPALRQQASIVIELHGTLGAGKTTFTRYLLRALGVQGRIKSPSYAVVEPHDAPGMSIWHFDFYRFNDPQEWEDAGFRDLFGSPGLKLVEWPEKASGLLPPADLKLTLTPIDDTQRSVEIQAETALGQQWLQQMTHTQGGVHG
ncbi:tRNA (adenosine(37)-N6)-threonylcarbamoyltransferase complex ATPase subunit type 1 TsaE [Aquabacterium sp.]|uniref:tRNA (adenosine(37)-N6)-threonylcarbamoyltransferase complex ATPase subunit type 1 TsaE n=1 Tax=Aquabacterium sp. TaxID=1872578 RepID=UPI0035B1912D